MSATLTSYCKLAGWAAFNRSQEVFDACGEIFEKSNVDVEMTSPLGIRLTLFQLHQQLNSFKIEDGSVAAAIDLLESIVRNFWSLSKNLYLSFSINLLLPCDDRPESLTGAVARKNLTASASYLIFR